MKFNMKIFGRNKVTNYEGAEAFVLTPQMELYSAVASTSLNDSFYEKADDRLLRIRKLIAQNDAAFVAKLAVYAREEMYLRSVPLALAVELAKTSGGKTEVSKTVARVVQRADEITELLAYYQLANNRKGVKKLNKLSKQVQKGLAVAFNKFDEYQFAKYNRDAEVKLRDALFLVHPKAKDEAQQVLFNKIAKDELKVADTWETKLSATGQKDFANEAEKLDAKKVAWEEMIMSGKMGYMAVLRNLRNILDAKVSEQAIQKVCSYISNANAVAKSKQFPFRFVSAYRELKNVNSGYAAQVLDALEDAITASAANIAGYDGNTSVVVAVDFSGSMQTAMSAKSSVQMYEVGLIMAMLLKSRCKNVVTGIFGDNYKIISVPSKSILANVETFRNRLGEVGHSTYGYKVIQDLINRKAVVDKVMVFTDLQMYNENGNYGQTIASEWKKYKAIAPNAKIYLFDLAGYGNSPLNIEGNDVFMMAGWSDKVFDVLHAIENGSNAVAEIEKIEL
ncbi:MAG TPA: TROVE domain-containing protein [Chitinophagales bacterium]|nr:TROVE domain-containing protein [Chitinophagales bacterium]